MKQVKYEPVEDLEFVKDKELNEKLATLLSNFWTLQWKAVSDAVEQSSRQCKYSSVRSGLRRTTVNSSSSSCPLPKVLRSTGSRPVLRTPALATDCGTHQQYFFLR